MGYTTNFSGAFKLDKPLTEAQAAYINRFSGSRRMKRQASIAATFPDPLREAVGLPIGTEGEFYVGSDELDKQPLQPGDPRIPNAKDYQGNRAWMLKEAMGATFAGQRHDASVIDYNHPPITQPGLWCQWVVGKDNQTIEWDGSEKFYAYIQWLRYIIANFLQRWNYVLNGEVEWQGEESADFGKIIVKDNVVTTAVGRRVYDSAE